MKRPQYFTIGIAVLALFLLFIFGKTIPDKNDQKSAQEGHAANNAPNSQELTSSFSIDSVVTASKQILPTATRTYVNSLEQTAAKTSENDKKIHELHGLAQFWRDSAKAFLPYAWYSAESARLENSEKNLNFAGHLFLNNLQNVEDNEARRWMALQAKDLLERSLKLNPDNDSAKVGIGAAYLFGGISNAPMEGIAKIREVVDKDSNNLYAQMTLATASLMSGQTDKARERLETVNRIDPKNIQAILLLADLFEKQGDNANAVKWYQKALPLTSGHSDMKNEVEKRIKTLQKL